MIEGGLWKLVCDQGATGNALTIYIPQSSVLPVTMVKLQSLRAMKGDQKLFQELSLPTKDL
jgi:hypothetical protein